MTNKPFAFVVIVLYTLIVGYIFYTTIHNYGIMTHSTSSIVTVIGATAFVVIFTIFLYKIIIAKEKMD